MSFTLDTTIDMSGLKNLEKSLRGIKKKHIKYGWYEGKTYTDGKNRGIPIAQIANWQEYGKSAEGDEPSIPARPYFRQARETVAISHNQEIKNVFIATVNNQSPIVELNKLANALVIDYKQSVARQNYTKLSDITIKKKGHSYQMKHTEVMMDNFKARVYKTSLKDDDD